MNSKPECKLCTNGRLSIVDVPRFPSKEVHLVARGIFYLGGLGLFLCALGGMVLIVTVVTGEGGPRFAPIDIAIIMAFVLASLFLTLIGAIFSMTNPVLQCTHCSATLPAG